MGRREELLRGMGSIDDVTDVLMSQHATGGPIATATFNASVALQGLIDAAGCPQCAVALACSVLNEFFAKSSALFYLDSTGKPWVEFVTTDIAKGAMIDRMGLPQADKSTV
jgi:hypothetical protein